MPPERRGGYDHWLASDRLEFASDAHRTVVFDGEGEPVRLPGYRSDALVDAAIRFVADHHERPFLLFLSLLEPHHQNPTDDYPAPAGYRERYEGRWLPPDLAALGPSAPQGGAHRHIGGYPGQIKRVDEGVGRLRDALRSLGVEDDTVFACTADHGSHFRTRDSAYKRSAHEASVRVPWVLTGPGRGPGGAGGPDGAVEVRGAGWRPARTRGGRPPRISTGRRSCTTLRPIRTSWRTWWYSPRTARWRTGCGTIWPRGRCGSRGPLR